MTTSEHAAAVDPTVKSVVRLAHDYSRSGNGWKRYGRRSWSRSGVRDFEPSDIVVGSAGRSATGAPDPELTAR